jgi:hypothetical protein
VASRTRNRALGIAALLLAVAAAVVILLLSQGGDDPKVTPLRENAAQHGTDGDGPMAGPLTEFRPPVRGGWGSELTGGKRGKGKRKSSTRRTATRENGIRHERIFRPSRAFPKKKPHRRRTIPAPPPSATAPQPVSAPAAPAQPPAGVVGPSSPIETPAPQPDVPSKDRPDDAARPVEVAAQVIEIEDGEIEDGVKRIKSSDGHIQLRIRSDEPVLVDLEDSTRTWLVPAGVETLIEFVASSKNFKLELHHHKGMLVLHLRD